MTDAWSGRAQAFRESVTHASGDDLDLVVAWCEPGPGVNVLDVATGGGHVARRLREAGAKVVTVDAAPGMVPDVIAPADHLPFADGSFDAIVSNSTLDHFETIEELVVALRELARITRPGGTLVLTLDNLANPVVALRSVLPQTPLRRLGLVPYYVGATCGPRQMCTLVREAGFEVDQVETLMHCPRVLAVATARVVDRYGSAALQQRFLRHLTWYDRLGRWPTRHLTSYFTAVRAVRAG